MKTRKTRLLAFIACFSMLFANHVQAQITDDLQSIIDRVASTSTNRASATVTEIDLSAYSKPRTTTLYIRNGANIRFVNGTLKRAESLTEEPLIAIQTDSRLELSSTAVLSGNNVSTVQPVVNIENGTLAIEGGKIVDVYGWENPSASSNGNTAVELSGGDDAEFFLASGEVLGRIENRSGGFITIRFGIVYRVSTSKNIKLWGEASIKANVYFYNEEAKIILMTPLQKKVHLSNYKLNQEVLTGGIISGTLGGVNWPLKNLVSSEDVDKLELGGNKNNYLLSLENNSIYVREKNIDYNLITSEDDLQKRLDEIAEEKPKEPVTLTIQDEGITIFNTVVAESGCNAIITGGKITVSENFSFRRPSNLVRNCIFDNHGSLTFHNITIDSNNRFFENAFFNNYGFLTIGNNVKFENISQEALRYGFYNSFGTLTVFSGDLTLDGPVFYPTHGGKVFIYGGNYKSLNGKALISGDGEASIYSGNFEGGKISLGGLLSLYYNNPTSPRPTFNDVSVIERSNVHIYGEAFNLPTIDVSGNKKLTLYYESDIRNEFLGGSPLKKRIFSNWTEMELGEAFIVSGSEQYPMMKRDFEDIEFINMPDDREAYFDDAEHCVKLRLKANPNLISNEDDLQKRLDEIAASDEKTAELTIAEQGITLTKGVYVRSTTNITLTGGTISLADTFNDNAAFYLENNSSLKFSNIGFDLRSVYLPTSFVYSLSLEGGHWRGYLDIAENVTFSNIYKGPKTMSSGFFSSGTHIYSNGLSVEVNNGSIINGEGEVALYGCTLKSTGGYPTVTGKALTEVGNSTILGEGTESAVIDTPEGYFTLNEGGMVRAEKGNFVVKAEFGRFYGGKMKGGESTFQRVEISENVELAINQLTLTGSQQASEISGNAILPRLYVMNGVKIELTSAMTDTWIIDGKWNSFDIEEPYNIISGNSYRKYNVTENDYSRMQFANLPNNMEAFYNADQQVVQLKKSDTGCDLQSLIDGLCETGGDIPVPEGGADIGCEDAPDPLQCAVDIILDGDSAQNEPLDPLVLPTICMCCRCVIHDDLIPRIIRVNPYSSLTIRNYNITSDKYENQYILVRGTLIIDVNVYIYHFIRFIHIMPGGRVIWRGGHVEDVDEIVYNEGGTLEIEGDFDNGGKPFVNPKGCTLIIKKGTFKGDIENHGTLIIEGGEVKGKIENYGEFKMSGGTVDGGGEREINNHDGGKIIIDGGCDIGVDGQGCIWSETDIWIEGGVRVMDIHIKRGCRIHVIGKLKVIWNIHFFVIDDFDVYVPFILGDDSYLLTEEDFNYLQIEIPDGYRLIYHDGVVVIVRIPYDVITIVEYLDYFGTQGTIEKPWSFVYNKTNIDINIDWHILKDYHLIFDGGTFSMTGGDIYIDEGASLWLKNIKFNGEGHHIYVYGTLYIDENVDFAEIVKFVHICKGGVIRFVTKPKSTVNIVVEEEHIVTNVAVIYNMFTEWLPYLNIDLPNGYEWKYDEESHTIIIIFSSGISNILKSRDNGTTVYDLSGKQSSLPSKGLNIIGRKKFIVK